jgi:putative transposase
MLPVPLSRWSHHTPRSRKSQPDIGTADLIPVNNPLERIMKEIRRRTRVVGAFPDGQSCLNLAAARLRYIAGTAWSAKCYMNMRPLYQPQLQQTEAVA